MDRKKILTTVFAVAVVILFIVEIFAAGFFRTGINPFRADTTQAPVLIKAQGIAQFQATVRYYESYLIAKDLTQEQITQIKSQRDVLGVTNSQQGYIIELKSKEAVRSTYSFLQTINASAKAVAVFGAPFDIDVTLQNKTVLHTTSNDRYILRQEIEPIIEPGEHVNASMSAAVEGTTITGYSPLQILSSTALLTTNATIKEITSITTQFSIPWENRTQIDHAQLASYYGNQSVVFERKDIIIFTPSLNLDQLKEKKNLSYITFISENSASINKTFVDKNVIFHDFSGFNVSFPDSSVRVTSNKTVNLPYPRDVYFAYGLHLPDISTTLPVFLSSPKEYQVNDSLVVKLQVEMLGNTIQRIISVESSGLSNETNQSVSTS